MMHRVLFTVALVAAFALSSAQMMSPEPEIIEPMADGFFLWKAGTSPMRVKALMMGDSICLDDYPTGISIECYGVEDTKARFYVNGKFTRQEFKKPYTIAGDVKGMVRPWTPPKATTYIRCKLARRKNLKIRLHFRC